MKNAMNLDLKCLDDVVIAFDMGIADLKIIQQVYFKIIETMTDIKVLKDANKFPKLVKIENALYKADQSLFKNSKFLDESKLE